MKVVNPRCAGIDIHKKNMAVCVKVDRGAGSAPEYHKRKFATHTEGIRELEQWLKQYQVTEVGLESTGVYWKPVWNTFEGRYGLHLCNPQHVRAIPGSKTDLKDGTRITDLLSYGLLPESFIPPQEQRELRDLTRLRTTYTEDLTRIKQRIIKVLEDAHLKLGCVMDDVFGVSGREMLEAIAAGEKDVNKLAGMAKRKLKRKKSELRKALEGSVRPHHRQLLKILLQSVREIGTKIADLDVLIGLKLLPYGDLVRRLDGIPGVGRIGAAIILAEIGPNVEHWEDSRKLASWSCLCPGNRISGGKRMSGRTRRGNRWLRRGFCQMAWAASSKNGSYLKAQFRRLAGRRGRKRAVLAVAHTLVTVVYHLLNDPTLEYKDLGEDYFDKRDAEHTKQQLVKRLAKLGYEVTLSPKAA